MKDCQKKLYHDIGERIRKSRQEARISQEELAEYAGISGSYISDIEAGKRNFSVDVLMKIAEALQGIHRLDSTSRYTRNSSGAQSGYRAHPRRLISR